MTRFMIYGALVGAILTLVGFVSLHNWPALVFVGLWPAGLILGLLYPQIDYAPGIVFLTACMGINVILYSTVGAVLWPVWQRPGRSRG